MPRRPAAPKRKYVRKARPAYGMASGARRRLLYNPQPVFTETYKDRQLLTAGGTGFLLSANMDGISQLGQYSNLYTKYKILKVVFTLLPTFAGGVDQNNALWNNSQGTMSASPLRIVYSYNDSPAAAGPATEALALQENGCKIKFLNQKLVIPCRPTPDTKDANGVQLTQRGKFINFTSQGPNIIHYGVTGYISQYLQQNPQFQNNVDIYTKITFQLADPR